MPTPSVHRKSADFVIHQIFTSSEHKWRIYMPALHLGPYHAKKQSLVATWNKSFTYIAIQKKQEGAVLLHEQSGFS